jgi:hypothetical protein
VERTFVEELVKAKMYEVRPLHKLTTISATFLQILENIFVPYKEYTDHKFVKVGLLFVVTLNTNKRKIHKTTFCVWRH